MKKIESTKNKKEVNMKNLFIFGAMAAVVGYAAWKFIKNISDTVGSTPNYTYDDDILDEKPIK